MQKTILRSAVIYLLAQDVIYVYNIKRKTQSYFYRFSLFVINDYNNFIL